MAILLSTGDAAVTVVRVRRPADERDAGRRDEAVTLRAWSPTRVLDAFAPDVVGDVRVLADAVGARDGRRAVRCRRPGPGSLGGSVLGDRGCDARPTPAAAPSATRTPRTTTSTSGRWRSRPLERDRDVEPALVAAGDRRDRRRRRRSRHALGPRGRRERRHACAARVGFEHERDLLQMRVPLPLAETPAWPSRRTVRTFRPGEDDDAWLGGEQPCVRRAPGAGRLDARRTCTARGGAVVRRRGFLLAFDDEGLAGFCWTKVHPAGPAPRARSRSARST